MIKQTIKNLKNAIEKYYDRHICQINSTYLEDSTRENIAKVQAANPMNLTKFYENFNESSSEAVKTTNAVEQIDSNKPVKPQNLLLFNFKFLHSLKTEYEISDVVDTNLPHQSLLTRVLNFFINLIINLFNNSNKELNNFATNFTNVLKADFKFVKPPLLEKIQNEKLQIQPKDVSNFDAIKNHLYDASEIQKDVTEPKTNVTKMETFAQRAVKSADKTLGKN